MIEAVLLGVIIVLSALLLLQDRSHVKEKNNLINALIAKNAQEKVQLDVVSGVGKPPVQTQPELVPSDSLDDEEWEKVVGNI